MFRRPRLPARLREWWPTGAVLVGGAARDVLRGHAPHDWDWAVPGPQAAAETLAARTGGAVFALDEGRGYYRVQIGRGDGEDAEGPNDALHEQHDFVPLPPDLDAELLRRDFTVNALALHPDGQVSDPSGGRRDLRQHLLRMVSEANLQADPLRLLRAARLSVTLGFRLEAQTRAAVTRLAHSGLPLPAGERVREELHALLTHPEAARGVLLLDELGLLSLYLPELLEGRGLIQGGFHHLDVYEHGVEALHQLLKRFPDAPLTWRWAALLHDVGKPRSHEDREGRPYFHGHDKLGAQLARTILGRLREPERVIDQVSALIGAHMVPLPADERSARRFVHRRRALLPGLLAVMLADREAARGPDSSPAGRLAYQQGMDRVLSALDEQPSAPRRLLSGRDIMALLHLPPGPQVGTVLRALEEAQALGDVPDAEAARAWVSARYGG